MGQYHRDISNGMQFIRTILLGRTWNNQNRFQDQLSPRPYPKPNLPGGVAHLASSNQYHLRDARRTVRPTQTLVKQLTDGKEPAKSNKAPTPGKPYIY